MWCVQHVDREVQGDEAEQPARLQLLHQMTTSHRTAPSRRALEQQEAARAHWLLLLQNDGHQLIEPLHSQGRYRVLPMQDRENSWLAEREHQFVGLHEVASRLFQEATASQAPRTALRRVRLQRQSEFQ